jgi:hypothetical protein
VDQGVGPEFKPQYYQKKKSLVQDDFDKGGVTTATPTPDPHSLERGNSPQIQVFGGPRKYFVPPTIYWDQASPPLLPNITTLHCKP